jgi:hypothetical protein
MVSAEYNQGSRGAVITSPQSFGAVLTGWCELPWQFVLRTSTSLSSGRPFNVTTGYDNNGDNVTSDRSAINGGIASRNFGRGTPLYSLDLFLQKVFRLSERVHLPFRTEAINTLNHDNIVGRDGIYGQGTTPLATYGTPKGGTSNLEPNRQFQFMVRLQF